MVNVFFFSSRRRHTRYWRDWSSDVCSSDLHDGSETMTTMLTVCDYTRNGPQWLLRRSTGQVHERGGSFHQYHVLDGCHEDRKSTRLNSSHANISYAVFCLKKKKRHIDSD